MKKPYRLYIDESGDHTCHDFESEAKQYLGLTGCVIESEYYRNAFHPQVEAIKQKHFVYDPDDPVILHRKEIINRNSSFWPLRNPAIEVAFNDDLLAFLRTQRYTVISVVIDKKAQVERYGDAAYHPYHYCLAAILERYCGLLKYLGARGDVMAESRGKEEDRALKEAYLNVLNAGTLFRSPEFFKEVLTSKEIKLKPKIANIAGLQISDLIAYPCKDAILIDEGRITDAGTFGIKVCEELENKYNYRRDTGRVRGYGKIFIK